MDECGLTLALLMAGIAAHHIDTPLAANDFTAFADSPHARSYFHDWFRRQSLLSGKADEYRPVHGVHTRRVELYLRVAPVAESLRIGRERQSRADDPSSSLSELEPPREKRKDFRRNFWLSAVIANHRLRLIANDERFERFTGNRESLVTFTNWTEIQK